MLARLGRILLLILLTSLAGCALLAEPTPTSTSTPSATPVSPTPTWTPVPASPTPSSTPSPTSTSTPTPTPTLSGVGWSRFPNALDFRSAVAWDDGLWLAALSGLVRVDWTTGEWTVWTESDGLIDNTLFSLAEQGDWLWIGTQGGVARHDRTSGEWWSYTTDDGLSSNHDVQVYFDGEAVWAGTRNGLSWYDPVARAWESLYTAAGTELTGVGGLLGDGESLWISVTPQAGTAGGLLHLDRASGEWAVASRERGGPPFASFTLTQSESVLWAVPQDGLPWEYDKVSRKWRPLLEIDPDGLFLGESYLGAQFYAGALWLYAPHTEELLSCNASTRQVQRFPAEPLGSLEPQGQIVGHGETLWFTGRQGLLAFDLNTGEWQQLRWGAGPNAAHHILGKRDDALLIRSDLGVGFWEPGPQATPYVPDVGGIRGREVLSAGLWQLLDSSGVVPDGAVMEAGAQSVWLAEFLPGGLGAEGPPRLLYYSEPGVEPQQFELTLPSGWSPRELLPQSVGNTLWFAGSRGFLSYNPAVNQWAVFEVSDEPLTLWQVLQRDHTVWFITDVDVGQFDTNTGAFTLRPLPAVPSFEPVPALAVAPDSVWLLVDGALYGSELAGADWFLVDEGAGCLADATHLAYWHGSLWMGGTHGVGRLDLAAALPGAQRTAEWECFTLADGMLDGEFEQIYPCDSALWFSHSWRGLWRYKDG